MGVLPKDELDKGTQSPSQNDIRRVENFNNLADLRHIMAQLYTTLSASEFSQSKGFGLVQELAHYYMYNALFVDMGWTPSLGSIVTTTSIIREFKLVRLYDKLLHTFFTRLEQTNILCPTSNLSTTIPTWTVIGSPPTKSQIRTELKHLSTQLLDYPECNAEVTFLTGIAGQIYSLLLGRTNGVSLLFPSPDSQNFKYGASCLYENSSYMKQYKVSFMTEGLLEYISRSKADVVRILEIGAGTGGTTNPVLHALTSGRGNSRLFLPSISYTFTDISSFFISKAKLKFERAFPNIDFEFKLLDIEKEPTTQGYENSDYDVILAADVFHATKYLDDTLTHTRALLKPNGLLILGEIFESTEFIEVTFGLAEGWWRFSDDRQASPLKNTQEWSCLLARTGFVESFAVHEGTFGVMFALAGGH